MKNIAYKVDCALPTAAREENLRDRNGFCKTTSFLRTPFDKVLKNAMCVCLILFSILGLASCDELVIPNIEDDEVELTAPPDNHIAGAQAFTFWWEELDDADEYRFRIASPSFDSIVEIIVDTLTTETKLSRTLFEGEYEWMVNGRNSEFESLGSKRKLTVTVDSTENLATQTVLLQLPNDEVCLTQTAVQFIWEAVPGANQYLIQVGFNNFSQLVVNQDVIETEFLFNFTEDTTYLWRVRAENQTTLTFTPWTQRSFKLDRFAPSVPVTVAPIDGDTIIIANQNPDLEWNFAADAVEDILYLYADSNKDTLLLQLELIDNFYNLEDSNLDFSTTGVDDYYWQIASRDSCFNFSPNSVLKQFFIQE